MADPDLAGYDADGNTSVLGGVSSALTPDLMSSTSQLSWAINAELRKGKAKTRGAFVERAVLPYGNVQGAKFFSLGRGSAVVGISGRLYRLTTKGEEILVDSIRVQGLRSPQAPQMWMEQTTEFLVIQDGISRPLIYNGVFAREAKPLEVPLGKQMAFGNGRLWVAKGDGTIIAGDIAGTGTSAGSELNFLEDRQIFQGGSFQAPGAIRAMRFMPTNQVASGNGPLIVGGVDYTMSLKAYITDRTQWTKTEGFQTTIFPEQGIISHTCMQTSNLDVFFRDGTGGLRTLRQAIMEFEDAGTSPVSEDISRITNHESVDLLESCPAVIFDNRLIMGASPFMAYDGCVAFRHMVSYDLAPLATSGQKGKPIFDGQWEGFYVTHLFNIREDGNDRCFAIAKGLDGDNRLYEYVPHRRTDEYKALDGVNVKQPIQWQLWYPEMKFKSDLQYKRFRRLDYWLTHIDGNVNIKTYYTSDGLCDWKKIDEQDFCACDVTAENQDEHCWIDYCKGVQPQVISFEPEDVEGEEWLGYRFQFRFVITGECQVDKILAWAEAVDPVVYSDSDCREGINGYGCQFVEVTKVADEYQITQEGDSPQNYVDESDSIYEDEEAEEYVDG